MEISKEYIKQLEQLEISSSSIKNDKIFYEIKLRLLLLKHSKTCEAPSGTCNKISYCDAIKFLIYHISSCKENCPFPCCESSRIIIKHNSNCKVDDCEICSVVSTSNKLLSIKYL